MIYLSLFWVLWPCPLAPLFSTFLGMPKDHAPKSYAPCRMPATLDSSPQNPACPVISFRTEIWMDCAFPRPRLISQISNHEIFISNNTPEFSSQKKLNQPTTSPLKTEYFHLSANFTSVNWLFSSQVIHFSLITNAWLFWPSP